MKRTRLLRGALMANAAFSTTTGALMVLHGGAIAQMLGEWPGWLVTAIGGSLLCFAAVVAFVVLRLRPARALLVSALDLGWVLGTVPLVFVPEMLSPWGQTAVLVVAACVGTLAVAQLLGIRTMVRDDEPGRGLYRHCIRVQTDASADAMWQVVRDLASISQFSPDIATSSLRTGTALGVGAVRECSNTAGEQWAEQCEQFDDTERNLEVRFLADEPGFPYPAKVMFGGWCVTDGDDGATVEVWWSLTPTTPLGWIVVTLMGARIDGDFARVIARMVEAAHGRPVPAQPNTLRVGYC